MDKTWHEFDLLENVGVDENTIKTVVLKLRVLNGKRPATSRKTETELTEKLLECIFQSSKHFSESSLKEYNAAPADWTFVHAPGTPNAGERHLSDCETYYHALWSQAVRDRLPGFHRREPARRPPARSNTTLEAGLHAYHAKDALVGGVVVAIVVVVHDESGRLLRPVALLSGSLVDKARFEHERADTKGTDWKAQSGGECEPVICV